MINFNSQMSFYLDALNKENERITYQQSTGQLLQQGSDDTNVFSQILYLEDKYRIYGGISNQLENSTAVNNVTDSNMASMKNAILDIIDDILASVNAGVTQDDKLTVATALEGIKQNFLAFANTEINNEYIFAGSDPSVKPFEIDENGKVTYVGSYTLNEIPVDIDSYREVGSTGIDAFMYPADTAKQGETLIFSDGEYVVDNEGNTWELVPEIIEAGEKLNFLESDVILDNNGNTWTLNKLDSTLEGPIVPPATTPPTPSSAIPVIKLNGGYVFEDNLSSQFTDVLGNSVTSFMAGPSSVVPPSSPLVPPTEIRQYDEYGNLTGEKMDVVAIAPPTNAVLTAGVQYYETVSTVRDPELVMEARHTIFDDLDALISAFKGVDPNDSTIALTDQEQNDILRKMLDKIYEYNDELIITHSELGSRNKIIKDATADISSVMSNFDILITETKMSDLAKVTMEAKALELTFTALYSSINRLNNLSLVNYLG